MFREITLIHWTYFNISWKLFWCQNDNFLIENNLTQKISMLNVNMHELILVNFMFFRRNITWQMTSKSLSLNFTWHLKFLDGFSLPRPSKVSKIHCSVVSSVEFGLKNSPTKSLFTEKFQNLVRNLEFLQILKELYL